MPAEAGDEPSAEDAPTAAAAGVVPHLLILIESTSTGGDGQGGTYVAADIEQSTVQGTLCQLLHCMSTNRLFSNYSSLFCLLFIFSTER